MLSLYYTVSSGYENVQSKPINSLGGWTSSTNVQSGTFDGLFGEISLMMTSPNGVGVEYKAIVIKNIGSTIAPNVTLWFEGAPTDWCTFTIAAVMMNGNGDDGYYMEQISSATNKPLYGEFVAATIDDPASIGDIEPGGQIGLWLCRTIDKTKAKVDYDNVAEPDLNFYWPGKRYVPVNKSQEENVTLQINWEG